MCRKNFLDPAFLNPKPLRISLGFRRRREETQSFSFFCSSRHWSSKLNTFIADSQRRVTFHPPCFFRSFSWYREAIVVAVGSKNCCFLPMAATPLVAGIAVAATAVGTRSLIQAWRAFKARPVIPHARRFYPGGFQPEMTRREAALILGVREHAAIEKIREAHRNVMVANHPDAGGSHYLASKINQAKDLLTGNTKPSSSAF